MHKSAQFIVTTFHPQIVAVSDKAYGVEHRQRVSTVHECEREVALRFVRNDASHANRANQGADGAFHWCLLCVHRWWRPCAACRFSVSWA